MSIQEKQTLVRMYQPGDEYGIIKLFEVIFGRLITLKEWDWKYKGQGNEKVYSSVLIDEKSGIVGHYGGIPFKMTFLGREIRGLSICDAMIHPKFRGIKNLRALASIVPAEAVRDGIPLGYGFPNENTLLLPAEKLGLYEKIEEVLAAGKEPSFHNDIDRYVWKFFSLSFDDPRIDALWSSCVKQMKLSVIRDRRYLAWRYQQHPFFSYELWGLRNRFGNKLKGLAVLRREDEKMMVVDFLYAKHSLPALFKKIENYAFTVKIKAINLWFPPFLQDSFDKLGFEVKSAGITIPRTTYKDTLRKDEIKGNFFYTMGDADFL
jgi:hypothetical protein